MAKPLPCIICGFEPEEVAKGIDSYNQPYAATAFTSHGHYGSTVWDEGLVSQDWLEINICDACLVMRKAEVLRVSPQHHRSVEYETAPWNPER